MEVEEVEVEAAVEAVKTAKEKFQLNEANVVLSDPKKKAEYDRKTVSDID